MTRPAAPSSALSGLALGLALALAAWPSPVPAQQPAKGKAAAARSSKAPPPVEDAGVPEAVEGPDAGVARAEAPPAPPPPRFFEGMGRTEAEKAQLEELSRALETYEAESREFRREIQLLVEKKYEERRGFLASNYEKAIRDLEVLERRERLDAIAAFEEFLKRNPTDPRYTPDVMFRLAELYYEKSSDDQQVAQRDHEELLKKLDPEKNPEPPPEPKVDFSRSIALYQRLLMEFPSYKLNDASYYLLGYCQEKQDEFELARTSYESLIATYPRSRFATEAWMRIGEYYFDATEDNALEKAAKAYEQAIADVSHPLYDKALYKLGWTYYRMDRFDEAVDRFILLTDYYESEAKKKGDDEVGGDLRAEALQYTAISFVDEKWGSLAKAQEFFARRGGRRYEGEIYRRMGDVYFDQTKEDDAIQAYRLVLQKDPLTKDAPQVQQRIVQAFERSRRLEEAFAESSKLSNMFQPGTPWFDKWRRDPEVVQVASEMAEKSLYRTATYHHQQALTYKKEGKFAEAKPAFDTAAKAYGTYLERFPRSKNAYEIEFYLAECLYNSFQFAEAARHYAAVRDSAQDIRYKEDAAYSAVLAWVKLLDQEVKAGTTPAYPVVKASERPEGASLAPIPFAATETKLVDASDRYLKVVGPKDEKAPGVAYRAAEFFYTHNQLDEARKRFEAIVARFPKAEVAKFATGLLVETYMADKNWAKVEETATLLLANKDVIDPKSDLFKDLTRFKLGGRFKLAEQLMGQQKWDEAAKKYIELVDEEPKHEFADKALNNAAVCFENTQRFDSALKLYERIFSEYPQSKLADGALFRVALNAERSYDFEKAIDKYQKLVKDYPQAKDRESAMFNTARLLEGLQRYPEAAQAYLRSADAFPKSEEAPKNQFRAALIYEKTQEYQKEIGALNEFIAKFSGSPAQVELVVDARRRIAVSYQKLKKDKEAEKAFAACADEFDRRGLKPDANPIAADAAAASRFELAELEIRDFDRVKIAGSGKALEKSFKAKNDAVKKVQAAYDKVIPYKRAEWTLAALFRKGYVLERFAQTITETPVPPEVKRLGDEAQVAYQEALGDLTVKLEDRAVETYVESLKAAKQFRVSNEWTKRMYESINRFRPKEYPVLKDPKGLVASELSYPDGAIATIGGRPVAEKSSPQKLQEDDK